MDMRVNKYYTYSQDIEGGPPQPPSHSPEGVARKFATCVLGLFLSCMVRCPRMSPSGGKVVQQFSQQLVTLPITLSRRMGEKGNRAWAGDDCGRKQSRGAATSKYQSRSEGSSSSL